MIVVMAQCGKLVAQILLNILAIYYMQAHEAGIVI